MPEGASRRATTESLQSAPRDERHQSFEISDELVRPRIEPVGDLDADRYVEIADTVLRQSWQPLAAKPEDLPAGRAARDHEGRFALRRRHLNAGAADGFPDADRQVAVHVVTLADEKRVLGDAGAHDQISARSSERRGTALVRDAKLDA